MRNWSFLTWMMVLMLGSVGALVILLVVVCGPMLVNN